MNSQGIDVIPHEVWSNILSYVSLAPTDYCTVSRTINRGATTLMKKVNEYISKSYKYWNTDTDSFRFYLNIAALRDEWDILFYLCDSYEWRDIPLLELAHMFKREDIALMMLERYESLLEDSPAKRYYMYIRDRDPRHVLSIESLTENIIGYIPDELKKEIYETKQIDTDLDDLIVPYLTGRMPWSKSEGESDIQFAIRMNNKDYEIVCTWIPHQDIFENLCTLGTDTIHMIFKGKSEIPFYLDPCPWVIRGINPNIVFLSPARSVLQYLYPSEFAEAKVTVRGGIYPSQDENIMSTSEILVAILTTGNDNFREMVAIQKQLQKEKAFTNTIFQGFSFGSSDPAIFDLA